MLLYQQLQLDDDEDFAVGNIIVPMLRRGTINSYYARRRRVRSRRIWSTLEATLTDCQFRMYFQMSKEIFQLLCGTIEDIIGRDSFKSEDFLNELLISDDICCRMLIANECTSGRFICGGIKLAITLRILGGALALDMALLFDMSFSNAYKIFNSVVKDWLSHELFCPIDGIEYCTNDAKWPALHFNFVSTLQGLLMAVSVHWMVGS